MRCLRVDVAILCLSVFGGCASTTRSGSSSAVESTSERTAATTVDVEIPASAADTQPTVSVVASSDILLPLTLDMFDITMKNDINGGPRTERVQQLGLMFRVDSYNGLAGDLLEINNGTTDHFCGFPTPGECTDRPYVEETIGLNILKWYTLDVIPLDPGQIADLASTGSELVAGIQSDCFSGQTTNILGDAVTASYCVAPVGVLFESFAFVTRFDNGVRRWELVSYSSHVNPEVFTW